MKTKKKITKEVIKINRMYKEGISPKELKKMGLPIMAECLKAVQSLKQKTN